MQCSDFSDSDYSTNTATRPFARWLFVRQLELDLAETAIGGELVQVAGPLLLVAEIL